MTNTQSHATRELNILFSTVEDAIIKPFEKEIIAICEAFGKSGQSGGSMSYTARALSQAIEKLCLQETIAPLTGEDWEWNVVTSSNDGRMIFQNNRNSAVFKDGKDGQAYYLDAIIWSGEEKYDQYTGRAVHLGTPVHSRQYIKSFPFTPKKFFVDVYIELLPEDWNEEPFIEWDYYDTEEYEKTGVKNWKTEKYRNIVKDPSQLEKVWEYYDKK